MDMLLRPFAYLVGLTIGVAVALGLIWLTWQLWCFVLGAFWPTGPATLVNPNYWAFCGAWILIGLIGRNLFRKD